MNSSLETGDLSFIACINVGELITKDSGDILCYNIYIRVEHLSFW